MVFPMNRDRTVALVVLLAGVPISCTKPQQAQPPAYVAAAQCAACHAKIAQTYAGTAMARSFSRPDVSRVPSGSYFHPASGSHFTMLGREGRFYQRRHQTGYGGKEANVMEKEVHYVMGSGNHARTYLHRTADNRLIELPLGWYAERGGTWAMNPGYDRPDHPGFRRSVSYGCMFCHNGYPPVPAGSQAPGAEPRFDANVPEGIDCQRCHGPGGKHVQVAQTAGARPEAIRSAIVNPARLSSERQMEVCMQCHLETTSFPLPNAIVRFDRTPFSYRPGEPLGDFSLYFDHAPGNGRDDKFEIVSAAYRLRRSACFLKSDGRMTCSTCHNPHEAGAKPACQQCHESTHAKTGDCAGCHMPKRRTEDVVHAVVTDHYIQRHKPARDLLGPLKERHEGEGTGYRGEVLLYYPRGETEQRDLYLAVAQVIQKSNLRAGIPILAAAIDKSKPTAPEFYVHLGDAYRNNGELEKAIPVYEEALRKNAQSVTALLQLGSALRLLHQPERAASILHRTIQLDPNRATAWYELGMAALDQKKVPDAIQSFQKSLELDPDMAEAHNSLGGAWFVSGAPAKAEAEFREAIRIRPDYSEAHNNLGGLLAASDLAQACYHYETAIRFQPDYPAARYNYGLALARLQRFGDARPQIEAVLRTEPQHAEAHQALGAILIRLGHREPAIQHYREAIRLRPNFGRALIGLAGELLRSGNFAEAELHLQKALADSQTAPEAAALLQRIRQR
jgi:tetratricopeptide (TPR) repeat protein